jgi:hypothetical protein
MKKITKPISLIVSSQMHEMAGRDRLLLTLFEALGDKKAIPSGRHDAIARDLLHAIAHDAPMAEVYKALAAVTAIKSEDDVKEALQAVKDASA